MRGRQRKEIVYVERGGDTSAKWLFWGALLVSVVSWILTALISDRGRVEVIERRR
jgi:hypothetical protein